MLIHAGGDQDRQLRQVLAHAVGGFDAADAAQADVGEQQVERFTGVEQAQRGLGAADSGDLAGLAFQGETAQFLGFLGVLDEQDARFHKALGQQHDAATPDNRGSERRASMRKPVVIPACTAS